jgi:hypothetical protein
VVSLEGGIVTPEVLISFHFESPDRYGKQWPRDHNLIGGGAGSKTLVIETPALAHQTDDRSP